MKFQQAGTCATVPEDPDMPTGRQYVVDTYSLPGVPAGRQYMQVVDLLPEHMPPPDDEEEEELQPALSVSQSLNLSINQSLNQPLGGASMLSFKGTSTAVAGTHPLRAAMSTPTNFEDTSTASAETHPPPVEALKGSSSSTAAAESPPPPAVATSGARTSTAAAESRPPPAVAPSGASKPTAAAESRPPPAVAPSGAGKSTVAARTRPPPAAAPKGASSSTAATGSRTPAAAAPSGASTSTRPPPAMLSGASLASSLSDASFPQPRPSHPEGAWGGRQADEVIIASRKAEVGQRIDSMTQFLSRLEKQADALEVEMGMTDNDTEAVEEWYAARQLGAREFMLGHLERQVELALREGREDLLTLDKLAPRPAPAASPPGLAASSARASAPPQRRSAPRQLLGALAPARPQSARPQPSAAPTKGGSTGAGRGGGAARSRCPTRGQTVTAASTANVTVPATKPVVAPAPTAAAASCAASSAAPTATAAASSTGQSRAVKSSRLPAGRGSGPPAEAPQPHRPRRPGWKASSAPQRSGPNKAPTTQTGRQTSARASGGADAVKARETRASVKRSALVSASELLRVSAERQRQKHVAKRLAEAEATLNKLLEQGAAPELVSSIHQAAAAAAPATARPPLSKVPASAAQHATASGSASLQQPAKERSAEGAAAHAPNAAAAVVAAPPEEPMHPADRHRRQEIAALVDAESTLLDAMLGGVPAPSQAAMASQPPEAHAEVLAPLAT